MKHFVKTVAGKWEEVTEHVFKNRKFVISDNGDGPRYGENFIVQDGSSVQFNGTVDAQELGQICRFLSVTIPTGSFQGGLVTAPAMVRIHKGPSKVLHVLATGENWKKAA